MPVSLTSTHTVGAVEGVVGVVVGVVGGVVPEPVPLPDEADERAAATTSVFSVPLGDAQPRPIEIPRATTNPRAGTAIVSLDIC